MHKSLSASLVALACLISGSALAQYVYPAKGQSAEQQKKDEYECHSWAVGQTGVDPTKPAAAAPAPAPAPTGGRVRGAAVGATVAAITDNDVGKGAAAGAVGGAAAQRGQRRQQAAAQQQQATAQTQGNSAAYNQARAACLSGRGYSVK